MQGARKKDKRPVIWNKESEKGFEKCKYVLANATLHSPPIPNVQLALKVDASNVGIGAVVEHLVGTNWQPLAFSLRN